MFLCKNWVVDLAFNLCAFDLAVPIRTFDQTDHQAVIGALGQINQVINDKGATFLISLNHKTHAIPAR